MLACIQISAVVISIGWNAFFGYVSHIYFFLCISQKQVCKANDYCFSKHFKLLKQGLHYSSR